MIIRVATVSRPLFRHGPMVVGKGWAEFDLEAAGKEGIEILRSYTGRIIRIHPDDVESLEPFGITVEGGKVVDFVEPAPEEENSGPEPEEGIPATDQATLDVEASPSTDDAPVSRRRGKKARR